MTETGEAAEPGVIEIDRSGPEPLVSIGHPPGPYTLAQLRMYGSYLVTVADGAAERPEPEVDELVAVFGATKARWLNWEEAAIELARAALAAGYKRDRGREPVAHAGPSPAGARLRQERERLGWSLREAERRTGIPNAHISQIETGAIRQPELATLAPLAAAYGLSLDELAKTK